MIILKCHKINANLATVSRRRGLQFSMPMQALISVVASRKTGGRPHKPAASCDSSVQHCPFLTANVASCLIQGMLNTVCIRLHLLQLFLPWTSCFHFCLPLCFHSSRIDKSCLARGGFPVPLLSASLQHLRNPIHIFNLH